jgi:hypothetical protein
MTAKHSYMSGGGHGGGFVPCQEIYQLTRLIRENRGRLPGDLGSLWPIHGGDLEPKSFRIWAVRNIVAWQMANRETYFASVEIENLSRSPSTGLAYHIDFHLADKGKTDHYLLRISDGLPGYYVLIIQKKDSPRSYPLGLPSAKDGASIVWSKSGQRQRGF